MNELTKSTEKKNEKLNDVLSLRESLKLKNDELEENSQNTIMANLCIYDLISITHSICKKENTLFYEQCKIKDDYELTKLSKPFICIGKKSLIVVINFGSKPKENQINFIKNNYFIPINYKAKRLYERHNKSKSEEKTNLFYTCKVTNIKDTPLYSIVCDDGFRISGGKEIFIEFSAMFDSSFDFKSIDDFFGITETGIQKEFDLRKI